MQQIEPVQETRIVPAPLLLRSKVLLVLGWALLILSLVLLSVHALWMWKRMGDGAPLVAVGLVMDALVGVGMILAGFKLRRNDRKI